MKPKSVNMEFIRFKRQQQPKLKGKDIENYYLAISRKHKEPKKSNAII